jgi:hypothetical protein
MNVYDYIDPRFYVKYFLIFTHDRITRDVK